MPRFAPPDTMRDMTIDGTEIFVLSEFRLRAVDDDGAAAAIVSAASRHDRDLVPLLTSIDDPRDVATLRTLSTNAADPSGADDVAALGPLVATRQPVKRYRSRIAERSEVGPSSSFRLAVTESGINDEDSARRAARVGEPASGDPVTLLVIGTPEGTRAGLLVLVGRDDAQGMAMGRDDTSWPLPLSRGLGVRIYQGARSAAKGA